MTRSSDRVTVFFVVLAALAACPADGAGENDDDSTTGSDSTNADSNTVSATNSTTTATTMTDTITATTTDTTADSSSTDPTVGTDSSATDATSTSSGSTTDTDIEGCAQVQLVGELYAPDTDGANVGVFRISGELLGDPAFRDRFSIEFYADTTGVVDLASAGVNDNYATCGQCLRIIEDLDFDAGAVARIYFQAQGSMDIDGGSDVGGTSLTAELTGVRLVEVTIEPATFESTPVPDGACVDIVDTTITGVAIPPEWTCGATLFSGFDGCDCGCGLTDLDCLEPTADACNFCDGTGSCGTDPCPGMIDPLDNAVCV